MAAGSDDFGLSAWALVNAEAEAVVAARATSTADALIVRRLVVT
jgi:hypothetical protein